MENLDKDLTVFLITCGENSNYNACIDALKKQTVKFNLEIIKDFAPMSKAFQEMLNRCKTKYFIQCDGDMILEKNAIEIMYNEIKNNNLAMLCYELNDVHLSKTIFGIKIYNWEIFRKFPYNLQTRSCEMEQLKRIEKAGYKWKFMYGVVGLHSPIWSDEDIFERYYDLMKKYKKFGYGWMKSIPHRLMGKMLFDKDKKDVYAFLGAITGLITEDEEVEKDFKTKNKYFTQIKDVL